MSKILLWIGKVLEIIRGPSFTTIVQGNTEHSTHSIRPTNLDSNIDVFVESRQVTYITRYKRKWVPNVNRSIYVVSGFISPENDNRIDSRLFESVTYPLLCSRLLINTPYPHLFAINAFLDRIVPINFDD